MILEAFHAGQNAAVWATFFTLGFAAMIAPIGLLGYALSTLRLPRRLRARIIERRTRHRS